MKKSIVILIVLVLTVFGLQAKEREGKKPSSAKVDALMKQAETCFPPTAFIEMDLNNVNFGFSTGGLMWYDGTNQFYEVPKNSGLHSIFAGGLWMGGISATGELKLAALTFGQNGTDYWAGPLTIGDADEGIDKGLAFTSVCQEYDRHYKVRRIDAQLHQNWHDLLQLVDEGADPSILTAAPFENGYSMPEYFNEWPGNNEAPGFNRILAPFYDRNQNGEYEPSEGDYPGYDITGEAIDCRNRGPQDPIPLFGDETIWWVFNDNGGIHTESTDGKPIQMEVQAQAFAYSTTDEINSMSFYNYVMINRGNQELTNTYFGQYADTDIGCAQDDFIGCDVSRGLGYAYNGDELDSGCTGAQTSYQSNTPALGIDFFEGPYLDPDGINNEISPNVDDWENANAIPYPGLGLGYYNPAEILVVDGEVIGTTDEVIDNERFGMRKFVYYNNAQGDQGDPDNAVEFYNYLTGFWANGEPFTYGGTGLGGDILCDYNFPNDTDQEFYFGTGGIPVEPWSEESIPNDPGDRRFFESAGPFTLEPGEFNNITVGIVWTQAPGGIEALREALFIADDKAQALFDNCFSILNGPKAPGISVQELDQEIILYLDPTLDSESYTEEDAAIPHPDNTYVFEGYKVYQLVSNAVSSADLNNSDKARLVAQVDIENGVGDIFNYVTIEGGLTAPELQVSGNDQGLEHSFRIQNDLFSGAPLINHQKYYFMAISYGYNNYEDYDIGESTGQANPYIESRLSYTSGTISPIVAVPHKTGIENNGTVALAEYGDLLPVTRLEGKGSGGSFLELTQETIDKIMDGEPWIEDELDYELGKSPIRVKIVDPLRVRDGDFRIRFFAEETPVDEAEIDPLNTKWFLSNPEGDTLLLSEQTIDVKNEFLLLDYGIAIEIENPVNVPIETGLNPRVRPTFNGATITYEDPQEAWLDGFRDTDDTDELNWIRAGGANADCIAGGDTDPNDDCYYNDNLGGALDPDEDFESVLQGIVAPWILVGHHWSGPINADDYKSKGKTKFNELNNINIVFTDDKSLWTRVPVLEIQHFPELAQNGGFKGYPRAMLSVDKNGRNVLDANHNHAEAVMSDTLYEYFINEHMYRPDIEGEVAYELLQKYKQILYPNDPDAADRPNSDLYGQSFGYGWFPGYAIDVETGERLNMAFGENSGLGFDNGADMIWNPTSREWNDLVPFPQQNPVNAFFGGMHYIYVFRNESRAGEKNERIISYDESRRLHKTIFDSESNRERTLSSVAWCMLPRLKEGFSFKSIEEGLIKTETTVRLRVNRPFERYAPVNKLEELDDIYFYTDSVFTFFNYDDINPFDPDSSEVEVDEEDVLVPSILSISENDWFPYYSFSTKGSSTILGDLSTAKDLLDEINVVPNPYYGFSDYENNRLDNRVKIINLPNKCTIKIFNTAGTLVRTINHDVPSEVVDATVEEWDLKNEDNISISGGTYILHIEAPELGTKIVKWFGVTRKLDLQNY